VKWNILVGVLTENPRSCDCLSMSYFVLYGIINNFPYLASFYRKCLHFVIAFSCCWSTVCSKLEMLYVSVFFLHCFWLSINSLYVLFVSLNKWERFNLICTYKCVAQLVCILQAWCTVQTYKLHIITTAAYLQ